LIKTHSRHQNTHLEPKPEATDAAGAASVAKAAGVKLVSFAPTKLA